MLTRGILVVLLLLTTRQTSAQVLFTSDFSTSSPYGFTGNWGDFTYYSNSASSTGGPGDRAWLRQTHSVTGTTAQYYHGWEKTSLSALSQGSSRFFRMYLRIGSGFNATGNGDPWGTKFIIWGDQQVTDSERIMVLASPRIGFTDFQIRLCENISSDCAADINLTKGEWLAIQWEVETSSTTETADGCLRQWVNNDTEGSPTEEYCGVSLNAAAMSNYRVGFFAGATLATGGNAVLDFAKVEAADAFDASWYADMQGASPTPQKFRLRIKGADLAALGLIPIFFWRQRR